MHRHAAISWVAGRPPCVTCLRYLTALRASSGLDAAKTFPTNVEPLSRISCEVARIFGGGLEDLTKESRLDMRPRIRGEFTAPRLYVRISRLTGWS